MRDLINELKIPPPSSIPDHSILSGSFYTSFSESLKDYQNIEISNYKAIGTGPKKKKNLKKINENFFMTPEIGRQVCTTIERIENSGRTQQEVDEIWLSLQGLYMAELENLPPLPTSQNQHLNRSFRKCQPFWNDELYMLWTSACKAEKDYSNFKVVHPSNNQQKNHLRLDFRDVQKFI